ncbi:MAG: type 4a pilus biogenesis protein PilO [Planctomycetota bacterium]
MKPGLTKADTVGLVTLAVITAAGWLLGIRPVAEMKAQELVQAHRLAQAERGQLRYEADALAYRQTARALESRLREEEVTLEPVGAMNRRLSSLALLAEARGLSLGELTPGESAPAGPSVRVPITARGTGTYRQVAEFLQELHESSRDVSVSSFSMSRPPPGRAGAASFEFGLYWFAEP